MVEPSAFGEAGRVDPRGTWSLGPLFSQPLAILRGAGSLLPLSPDRRPRYRAPTPPEAAARFMMESVP